MGLTSHRGGVGVSLLLALAFVFSIGEDSFCEGGRTGAFVRNNDYFSQDMPIDSDVFRVPPGFNAPQQVHIAQGDHVGKGVIISWVTPDEPGSSSVIYWAEDSESRWQADGFFLTYKFFNYTSGFIHRCTIHNLEFDTKYYYLVGIGNTTRQFWFKTPPSVGPDVPYTFGIIVCTKKFAGEEKPPLIDIGFWTVNILNNLMLASLLGDLGQSYNSNRTLTHYELSPAKGQTILYVGDLSYANDYPFHDNTRWDTWGRFTERIAAYQPWIWTAGNHETDFAPELGETRPFKPYTSRYHVPYRASGSTSPLWYSIKRASAYIIVMSSYSAFGKSTPQYKWLEKELPKVNRTETPWLIILVHSPMYSSYVNHYMEGEPFRVTYEKWFVKYKVDIVFAGHVHAYERSERISNIKYNITNGLCKPINDQSAPVYITIGDGGNFKGLSTAMIEPQPSYSSFREASFGHGILDIKNRSHAHFGWNRNQDGFAVEADSVWLHNRYWIYPEEASLAVAAFR